MARKEAEVNPRRENMHASYHVILVCDVHHLSDVAVELGDRVPLFIQEFYSAMGEIVVSHGGRIVGYFGDCIFFLFGDSGSQAGDDEGGQRK